MLNEARQVEGLLSVLHGFELRAHSAVMLKMSVYFG